MITADGRSAVEAEIEQMHIHGLETNRSTFQPDFPDLIPQPSQQTRPMPPDTSSIFSRWVDRLFGLGQTAR